MGLLHSLEEICNVMPASFPRNSVRVDRNTDCSALWEQPIPAMIKQDDHQSPEERETVKKLKEAYMEDEGLPEELAAARASAEVNRLAGRTDDSFDARSEIRDKKGGFQTDLNEPKKS